MHPKPYIELSDIEVLTLCVWRESQNQSDEAQRAVAHSISNRVARPCWWSESKVPMPSIWHAVILKPWQYSSFNENDPNEKKWPHDGEPSEVKAMSICSGVILGMDEDNTDTATHYHDLSIGFPKGWGNESEWINTLNIDKLKFFKMKPAMNHEAVSDSVVREN